MPFFCGCGGRVGVDGSVGDCGVDVSLANVTQICPQTNGLNFNYTSSPAKVKPFPNQQ